MHSRRLGVVLSPEVSQFRQNLFSEEIELFNECLMRIYRDPHEDRIRKFRYRLRAPIVDYMYQDDDFVLIYYWELFSDITARRVTVTHAYRANDYDENFAGY